jgi:hypothetical protein
MDMGCATGYGLWFNYGRFLHGMNAGVSSPFEMKENNKKTAGKKGISWDPISCIRSHPVPALFFTFLGGIGMGALIAYKIRKIGESRAEDEKKKQGGVLPLLMTLITPYILHRILRMITK